MYCKHSSLLSIFKRINWLSFYCIFLVMATCMCHWTHNYEKSVQASRSEPSSDVTTEIVPCQYQKFSHFFYLKYNMKFEFLVLLLVLKYTINLETFLGKPCTCTWKKTYQNQLLNLHVLLFLSINIVVLQIYLYLHLQLDTHPKF